MKEQQPSRSDCFVAFVLERSRNDTGFAARLRRADNPDTEYQSWDTLAAFGVNLERDAERLPFALIGAALCRLKPERDGNASLGAALRSCFEESADQGEVRLRRLLTCDSPEEACRVLRPLLGLLAAKAQKTLCFARLLNELLYFCGPTRERIKIRWAQDYYRNGEISEAVNMSGKGEPS